MGLKDHTRVGEAYLDVVIGSEEAYYKIQIENEELVGCSEDIIECVPTEIC